jgi:hypothetical protein
MTGRLQWLHNPRDTEIHWVVHKGDLPKSINGAFHKWGYPTKMVGLLAPRHNGEPPMIQNGHHIATSPPKAPKICTSSQQKATLPSHYSVSPTRHHATIENGHGPSRAHSIITSSRKVFQETTIYMVCFSTETSCQGYPILTQPSRSVWIFLWTLYLVMIRRVAYIQFLRQWQPRLKTMHLECFLTFLSMKPRWCLDLKHASLKASSKRYCFGVVLGKLCHAQNSPKWGLENFALTNPLVWVCKGVGIDVWRIW